MPTNNISLTTPTETGIDVNALQRRMALAQALQQQSMENPKNEMVSGIVVKQSPIQGLARLAQALMAKKMNTDSDAQMRALAQQQQQNRIAGIDQMGDIPPAIKTGLTSPDPFVQQLAMKQLEHYQNLQKPVVVGRTMKNQKGETLGVDETWQAEQEANRQQKIQELTQKANDAKALQAERLQAQRELRALIATQKQDSPHPVTVIDPETGRQVVKDAKTGKVYGLSPGDTKLQGAFNQDTAALAGSTDSMDRLARAAKEVLDHPGLGGITGLRGSIPNMPGSAAADAQAKLNTLKSQVGFGVLQDMRNNSKTGGALGSVSDAEGKRLEANLAALENAQSEAQMRDSLKKIMQYSEDAKGRLRNAYNLKHGDKAPVQTEDPLGLR